MAGDSMYTTKMIAELFDLGERSIQQLTKNGILPVIETEEGRRYELVPTVQSYIQHLKDKASGKNRTATGAKLKEQKMRAEIALKESQGELHQLKTAIAAGKYIAVEEVTLDYQKFFVNFKKFAMGLPVRLVDAACEFAEIDPLNARRMEKTIQSEIQNMLTSFVVAGVTELPKKGKHAKG